MRRDYIQWFVLGGLLVLCFGAASIGSMFTGMGMRDGWYEALAKPSWNPPDSVFAPVWTALYAMMAVAAWLAWRKLGWRAAAVPLGLWLLQLGLNVAWSGAFFAAQSPLGGLAVIFLLWWAILATLIRFWRATPIAGLLFVPYLAWVSFAAALNFAIWRLNA